MFKKSLLDQRTSSSGDYFWISEFLIYAHENNQSSGSENFKLRRLLPDQRVLFMLMKLLLDQRILSLGDYFWIRDFSSCSGNNYWIRELQAWEITSGSESFIYAHENYYWRNSSSGDYFWIRMFYLCS
jgi:hypothetical protein